MAYVPPSGVITLYNPTMPHLSPDYNDTIEFANSTYQQVFFESHIYRQLSAQTYTHRGRGVVRINLPIGAVQGVFYLSYKNPQHENRTFYCFVVNVAYVNENTTDMFFNLDVIQTYIFDITPKTSYIAREHVTISEDNLLETSGIETIPEGLEYGQYRIYDRFSIGYDDNGTTKPVFDTWKICVCATFDKNFNNAVGGMINEVYCGLCFNVFDTPADVNSFLLSAANNNKADGIVSIFMVPAAFVDYSSSEVSITLTNERKYGGLLPYTPRNKKLLCAPYITLYATDNNGSGANFRFEDFFNPRSITFKIFACCAGSNEFSLVPQNYKGITNNYNEQLILNITPQCAYATDSYRAWLAQNSSKMSIQQGYLAYQKSQPLGTTSIAGFGAGMAKDANAWANGILNDLRGQGWLGKGIANVMQGQTGWDFYDNAVQNAANKTMGMWDTIMKNDPGYQRKQMDLSQQIAMLNAEQSVASTMPPQAKGGASGMTGIVSGAYSISLYRCCIDLRYARRLDDYFDRFGYQVNIFDVPNWRKRRHWDYIKCVDFCASGALYADDFNAIKAIFENGIRFWHIINSDSEYLDYSQDNHLTYQQPLGT